MMEPSVYAEQRLGSAQRAGLPNRSLGFDRDLEAWVE